MNEPTDITAEFITPYFCPFQIVNKKHFNWLTLSAAQCTLWTYYLEYVWTLEHIFI